MLIPSDINFVAINLGCGNHTSPHMTNLDFSKALRVAGFPLIGKALKRRFPEKFSNLNAVTICDLRKGIPFKDNSVDLVYHSHFLEHLTFEDAPKFLEEVRRVLKPSGIHRIVIPDFSTMIKTVALDIKKYEETGNYERNNFNIFELLEQSVRVTPAGLNSYSPFLKFLMKIFLGDAPKRGEVHRMMYTPGSITDLLTNHGFYNLSFVDPEKSSFRSWKMINLDLRDDKSPFHPNSLFVECQAIKN